MKKLVLVLISFALPLAAAPTNCEWNGKKLYGKVKVVEIGEDIRVKIVEIAPDKCGKWQYVEIGEDLRVKFVEIGEDIRVRFVEIGEGVRD